MKKRFFGIMIAAMLLLALLVPATATAATQAEIEQSCEDGLAWLAGQQNWDGSWVGGCNSVGTTALAVLKFETHAVFMGMSPFDPAYAYHQNVEDGLDYIFTHTHTIAIATSPQPHGDPDTNGNGLGVFSYYPCGSPPWSHATYETGIALMAVCASQEPTRTVGVGDLAGWTYTQVAQDMVDYFAFGQNDADWERGGWRYYHNSGDSDNSTTGYATLGLSYAEAPAPWGFGLTVPSFVFDELEIWIDYIQNDVNGDLNDGGSGYTNPNSWVNILKTGNLLNEMALVGDTQVTGRVQDAIDYMERSWNIGNPDPGWKWSWNGATGQPHYQACFTSMKGFQALGIDTFGAGPINWYNEMADAIVGSQQGDGGWPSDYWGGRVNATAWALLTMEKAAPPALQLIPPVATNPVGTSHTVTAIYKIGGQPQADVRIDFEIIGGPNDDEPVSSEITNASGEATFTYTGDGGAGVDVIKATAIDATGAVLVSATAEKTWIAAPPPVPGITGWGILTCTLILAGLTVAMLLRRKQVNVANC